MPLNFRSPDALLQAVASKAKAKRLSVNLTRRTLAAKSGVSEASIKRFETTGEVNFRSLLQIAYALDCMAEFEQLFEEQAPQSIADLRAKPKQRGRL